MIIKLSISFLIKQISYFPSILLLCFYESTIFIFVVYYVCRCNYLYRPSLLNHSCWPNCTVCYNGRTMNIRMLEDIADDQEVIMR